MPKVRMVKVPVGNYGSLIVDCGAGGKGVMVNDGSNIHSWDSKGRSYRKTAVSKVEKPVAKPVEKKAPVQKPVVKKALVKRTTVRKVTAKKAPVKKAAVKKS